MYLGLYHNIIIFIKLIIIKLDYVGIRYMKV